MHGAYLSDRKRVPNSYGVLSRPWEVTPKFGASVAGDMRVELTEVIEFEVLSSGRNEVAGKAAYIDLILLTPSALYPPVNRIFQPAESSSRVGRVFQEVGNPDGGRKKSFALSNAPGTCGVV
jgi:hypothetical protein